MPARRRRRDPKPPKSESGGGLGRAAAWATILGTAIALVALLVSQIGGGDSVSTAGSSPGPHLQGDGLEVRNDLSSHPQKLEVLLDNAGGKRSVVSGARIEIVSVDLLRPCFSQGDLPAGGRYGLRLPIEAKAGETIEVPLHQQLAADEAERLEISLGLGEQGRERGGMLSGMYLFELNVSLLHDGQPQPLPIDRALVALPGLPNPGEYFWTSDSPHFLDEYIIGSDLSPREFWAAPMRCWRANTAALERVLSGAAKRSPQMAALASEIVAPNFAALQK